MKNPLCNLPLALVLAAGMAMASAASAQQAFATQEEAAQKLVAAISGPTADEKSLAELFGSQWRDYVPVGSVDRRDVDAFVAHFREKHAFQATPDGKALLVVGTDPWTLPVPLAKGAKGWSFDLAAGRAEIVARRIGRNEDHAVKSALAYHDAQMDYAEQDRDGDGVLEYARKFLSTDGQHDGLFWDEDDSGEVSPLGPLFGDALPGTDWHGYQFRILGAQGPSAPGGAYNYQLGDNMSRGFALVAWPAKYADTGVMTFMISHDGEVFQKDLGPGTAKIAAAMKTFDPDDSWTPVPASEDATTR